MIELPDVAKKWDYENNFYLSCDNARFAKMLAHWELFKMVERVPGDLIECGVFKGASFVRFAGFRDLLQQSASRSVIGFDTFGDFPETGFDGDKNLRTRHIAEAGEQSISKEQLEEVLKRKHITERVELVEGDIVQTVPRYVAEHPDLSIALINLDTDIYEPAVTILEHLWPRISPGGVLILDDYSVFPGETKAVDDYFKGQEIEIRRFPFAATPHYIIKK